MHHVIDVQDILVASAFVLVPIGLVGGFFLFMSTIDFSK